MTTDNNNKPRVLSPEERRKVDAEAHKIEVETRIAEANAEINRRKLEAEATKAERELAKVGIELDKMTEELVMAQQGRSAGAINLNQMKRQEEAALATDLFHKYYHFTDHVDEKSVKNCIERLSYWHRTSPACPIEIVFTSPGGSIVEGFVLYDYIQELKRQDHLVTTATLGMAASMAGILLQAGNRRVMGKEAWMLIHEASFFAFGKIGEVEDTVEWVKKVQQRILDIFVASCTQAGRNGTASHPLTRARIAQSWKRKDWWLSSDECLKYGLVDEVR